MQWYSAAGAEEATLALDASKRLEIGRGRLVWLAMGPESAVQRGAERWRAMSQSDRQRLREQHERLRAMTPGERLELLDEAFGSLAPE